MTFRQLLRAFKRRFATIIYFLVCFLAMGIIYALAFNRPIYRSDAQFESFTDSLPTNTKVVSVLKSDVKIYTKVVNNLNEKNITHSNNVGITSTEILDGLSFSISNSSVLVSFTNRDSSITKVVLNEFMEVSQSVVVDSVNGFDKDISKFQILLPASEPVNIAKSNALAISLFSAFGLLLGCVIAIWVEIKDNSIFEPNDIIEIGSNVFPITYSSGGNENEK